jgi:hypothetical protein
MDFCVCLFGVCVVLCVSSDLAPSWSPLQRVPPTEYRIEKLKEKKKQSRSNKGLSSHNEKHLVSVFIAAATIQQMFKRPTILLKLSENSRMSVYSEVWFAGNSVIHILYINELATKLLNYRT